MDCKGNRRLRSKHCMFSFKRLEAAFWAARLGSFAAAAERLYTSESAISKRITELESFIGEPLFDRSKRQARLTRRGSLFIHEAEDLLRQRDKMMALMGKEAMPIHRFRIGVTELVALTWLTDFFQQFQDLYPAIPLEPEIDLSANLYSKLEEGGLDLIVVPPIFPEDKVDAVPLAHMELSWMCKPGLFFPADQPPPTTFEEIAQFPIITQIGKSGVDMVYQDWFKTKGAKVHKVYAGNSLVSLAALTVAGFGISYLPTLYFQELKHKGLLQELHITDPAPEIRYFAVSRKDDTASLFIKNVAELCVRCCNFSKPELSVA